MFIKNYRMNNTPLVSIITPVYNGEKFIGQTIETVLAQEYTNWEMLIVDDGSKDNSAHIVSEFAQRDNRVCLIRKTNGGSASARNMGLKVAKGRYICFLDADDLWLPDMLAQQVEMLQTKNAGLVYASYSKIDENGKDIYHPVIVPERVKYTDLLKTNSISCLTAMFDTEIVGIPFFDESLKSMRDDLAYWLHILEREPYAYGNKKILGIYRVYRSSTTGNKKKLIKPTYLFYYTYLKLGLFRSVYYTVMWGINGLKKYR